MKRVYLLIAVMVALLMSSQARAINDATCPELTVDRAALTAGGRYTSIALHQGGQEGGGALW